jgi:uncharacterized 2Fe-2S/4Fe-4S cluster protein (DUF4445 family)
VSDQVYEVLFVPGGQTASVPSGELLTNAALAAGVPLVAPCGGRGRCSKCRVVVEEGECSPPTEVEQGLLSSDELARGIRLACQTAVRGPLRVYVEPQAEVVGKKPLEAQLLADLVPGPAVRRVAVELPPPTLSDQRSDFRRLQDVTAESLGLAEADLAALRALPQAVRVGQWTVSATACEGRLVAVAAGSNGAHPLGAAVDIGTTTVVGYVVDLVTGEQVGSGAAVNPQGQHGADVISRTEYANSNPDGLLQLQREAAGVINQVLNQALASCRGCHEQLLEVVVVGNTCMQHLALGLAPRYLAEAPYVPVTAELTVVDAGELGVAMAGSGRVVMLPSIAGYVGADTVGVILATRMTERHEPVLAIDIGTNGEVALWDGARLWCASCAAGPAFEGAQIEHGMRAAPGAIERISLDDGDLSVATIGDQPAAGICGSGLFDGLAVMLETGLVDAMGRLAPPEQLGELPGALGNRLAGADHQRQVVLVSAGESANGQAVCLTQKDVREVQLAKGAVRAAIEILLKEAGLQVRDLAEVLIAGAFGSYIQPASALRMGLLPAVAVEVIRGVGNAAGAGAMMALLSMDERQRACQIARQAEHVELAQRADFQQMFMETMLFM